MIKLKTKTKENTRIIHFVKLRNFVASSAT